MKNHLITHTPKRRHLVERHGRVGDDLRVAVVQHSVEGFDKAAVVERRLVNVEQLDAPKHRRFAHIRALVAQALL
jgi:hypothetical protein